jgi:hypothetical protein
MGTFGHFLILGALVLLQNPSGVAGPSEAAPCPALPHFVCNACPFEGCTYRQWTAHEVVPVYDTWKERRREVARLAVGEKVNAITGVVIKYKPGVIRVDEDIPDAKLKQGDVILTYTCHGEGDTEACFKRKYYRFFDIQFSKAESGFCGRHQHCQGTYVDPGKKAWWAKVKLKSGRTGWVDMDHAKFDNVDRYG